MTSLGSIDKRASCHSRDRHFNVFLLLFSWTCLCYFPVCKVEVWLNRVLDTMRSTVRHEMTEAVMAYEDKPREQWLFDYPAQVNRPSGTYCIYRFSWCYSCWGVFPNLVTLSNIGWIGKKNHVSVHCLCYTPPMLYIQSLQPDSVECTK